MKPAFVALSAGTFTIAMGALWEIFEFWMDNTFGWNMQKSGLRDTMWDLIVDTAGASAVSFAGYLYLRSGKDSWLAKRIQKYARGKQ